MEQILNELEPRGTIYFPFQHYDMSNPNGTLYITAHWHDEVEILYVETGTLHLHLNGQMYVLEEGDIIFINSLYIHYMFPSDTKTHYYAYVFPLNYLSFETNDFTQKSLMEPLINRKYLFPFMIKPDDKPYHELLKTIMRLIELDKKRDLGYQIRTKSALYELLALLFSEELFEIPTSDPISEKYEKILSYIDNHFQHDISLESIADYCNMSPSYFCRYFKNNFGKTFVDYLNHLRVEKACVELAETSNSIIRIALDNGFHNISYFNKCFKNIMRLTPSQYRKEMQNNALN